MLSKAVAFCILGSLLSVGVHGLSVGLSLQDAQYMGACSKENQAEPWSMKFTGYKDGKYFRSACFELSASSPRIGILDASRTACNSRTITRIDFELDVENFWSGGVTVKDTMYEFAVIKAPRYSDANTLLSIRGLNIKMNKDFSPVVVPICIGLGNYYDLTDLSEDGRESINMVITSKPNNIMCCQKALVGNDDNQDTGSSWNSWNRKAM